MDFIIDRSLHLLLMLLLCVFITRSEGKPKSPNAYYAVTSSNIEFPCVPGTSGDTLRWFAEHASHSLRRRMSSYVDRDDPDLFFNVIKNVQPSDAGTFICSDGLDTSSMELVVIEPSQVLDTEALTNIPDEIKVKWKAPLNNTEVVKGYNIYVTEVADSGKEVRFPVHSVRPDGVEEFPLTDFFPGATYEIQVAALYTKGIDDGDDRVEGPRSPKIRITTQKFDAVPWKVKAEPGANSTILVSWDGHRKEDAKRVDGYIVYYQGIGAKKDLPSGQVIVTAGESGKRWNAVLKGLKTRMKYKIHVVSFTGRSQRVERDKSEEVVVMHDGFNPELSIRAVSLSPDTVLVSLDTVGGDKVEKLRMFYSDDSAITWEKIDNYKQKEKYAIVTGLQPRTRYFFMAKAQVNKKTRSVVTHVLTPPPDLTMPANVTVTAKSDSSVLVLWDYQARVPPKGFIVLVDKLQSGGSFSPDQYQVVLKDNEALVQGLDSTQKYQVKVEPFDVESVGRCSEAILFQLVAYDETTLSPNPAPEGSAPRFIDEQPEQLDINASEDVKLTCTALGTPGPTVQFYRDDLPVGLPTNQMNELILPQVTEHTVVTCRATNIYGSVERQTRIHVTEELEPEVPRFSNDLPETLIVNQGHEVRQMCEATGNPAPVVTWYKNGQAVRSAANTTGKNMFVERRMSRPFDLKCVAMNPYGSIESTIKLFVKELLRLPTIRKQLPRTIKNNAGEPLNIPCSFSGNPQPLVSWYDGNTRLTDAVAGQNDLTMNIVLRSTVLTCRGENVLGTTDEVVELELLLPVTTEPPLGTDYEISMRTINDSPSQVKVKWAVNKGILDNIRYFDIKLTNERGQSLISQRLYSNQRSMNFNRLSPQSRYIVNLQTVTSNGVVDNSSSTFTVSAPTSNNGEPVVYLDVLEIRHNTARVDVSGINVDPRQFQSYRLRVKDLNVKEIGNIILSMNKLSLEAPTIALDRLKPSSNYQVIIDALSKDGEAFLTTVANFSTSRHGEYGTPVSATSASSVQSSPQSSVLPQESTTTTTVAFTRGQTPLPPRIWPTESSTARTTAVVVTTESEQKVIEVPAEPDDEVDDNDYVMTAKVPNKTPYRVDIRWAVDRGPLENVKDFFVTIKGERGQILLQKQLPENQRYITIQSLSPNTRYFVNVKANGPKGTLVESDVDFKTSPADEVRDTSNPELELEANEVRAENARIDWTAVNTEPGQVKSYRLRVLDDGPDGFNLLTQKLNANSQSLNLQQLQLNKRYHVIVDALAGDDSVLLTTSLTFQTAHELNKNGVPVFSTSAQDRTVLQPDRATSLSLRDLPTPVLDFKINPEGTSSTGLNWRAHNVSTGLVYEYLLKVRSKGPDGYILLQERLPVLLNYFKLDGLIKNRLYFLELEGVARNGSTVFRAATPYTPGVSSTPLQVSSSSTDSKSSQQKTDGDSAKETDRPEDADKLEIDLELNPADVGSVRVNWTMFGGNKARPVHSFKVKVKQDGPEGWELLEKDLNINTLYYTLFDLKQNRQYYIHLDALDKDGRVIEYAASPYLVPGPGQDIEPMRTSSAFNKRTLPSRLTQKDDVKPEIDLELNPAGAGSVRVNWTVIGDSKARPVQSFKIKVKQDGPEGRQLLQKDLNINTLYYTVSYLQQDTQYYIHLDALDRDGHIIEYVASPYLVLPPGHAVEPIRTSSSLNQKIVPPRLIQKDDVKPEIDLELNPVGAGSVRVNWTVIGDSKARPVQSFKIKVKQDGPEGRQLLQKDLNINTLYYTVFDLKQNTQYYIHLDALDRDGRVIAYVASPYLVSPPGHDAEPISTSSALNPKTIPSRQTQKDDVKPEIDLELNPTSAGSVKINWTMIGGDSKARPVHSFKIKVKLDGPDGQELHEKDLNINTLYYTLSYLQQDIQYYIHLDALDKDGRVIEYVASRYLVPPPGHAVEPIRTSSVLNQQTDPSRLTQRDDQGSHNSDLAITKAQAQGPNTILLEWVDIKSSNGEPRQNTMVRYAVYENDWRGYLQIQHVPAPQRRLTISNLKAGTTYGIQVAAMATGRQFVNWSRVVLTTTAEA